MIELGKRARDTVTGFEGTVTARYEFLNGCIRYELEARVEKSSDKPECLVFDEQRLVPISSPESQVERRPTGGPRGKAPRTGTR